MCLADDFLIATFSALTISKGSGKAPNLAFTPLARACFAKARYLPFQSPEFHIANIDFP